MAPRAELIKQARAGDGQAFDLLIGPELEPAYRLACGMLLDPAAAEDAVQDAAVKAWRRLANLREGSDLRPWFLGIVANQCRTARRGRWWTVIKGIESRPPAAWLDAADRLDVERALARLAAQDRALLVLHYYHDLPLAQAGAILGLSAAAAKSRLYRALRRLRPELALAEVNC